MSSYCPKKSSKPNRFCHEFKPKSNCKKSSAIEYHEIEKPKKKRDYRAGPRIIYRRKGSTDDEWNVTDKKTMWLL